MTMHEYETLYQSSVGYGMRKALSGEQNRFDIEDEIEHLQVEVEQLSAKLVAPIVNYDHYTIVT